MAGVIVFASGEPQQFRVLVNSTANYPLDLYILMDLSASMSNDLTTVQSLSNQLGRNKWTINLQKIFFPSHTPLCS